MKQKKNICNNLALAFLNSSNYWECILYVDKVLGFEYDNKKALYRKIKAYMGLELYNEALEISQLDESKNIPLIVSIIKTIKNNLCD